jgi:nucleoside-diphosphate-sugar epimerase
MANELVLVTGGSGFIAVHSILKLLDAGYRVRTTVRSLTREPEVRAMLQAGGVPAELQQNLSFVSADLLSDASWPQAVAGCRYVLHVASPFPMGIPKHEDELIRPAREGTLRVLRAARDAGVERVVLTSSFAAIGYGHPVTDKPFSELDWTNPDAPGVSAYAKSKTLAERAAWDFLASEGGSLELAVINPVAVFGPTLGPDLSTSLQIVKLLLDRTMPACPPLSFGAVDVRDVALLHIRAMTLPEAAGQRYLAVAGPPISLQEIALLLKARLGPLAARVPTGVFPAWFLRITAIFSPLVAQIVPELGKVKFTTNEKARKAFDWTPISNEDSILATAESLIRFNLLASQAKSKNKPQTEAKS